MQSEKEKMPKSSEGIREMLEANRRLNLMDEAEGAQREADRMKEAMYRMERFVQREFVRQFLAAKENQEPLLAVVEAIANALEEIKSQYSEPGIQKTVDNTISAMNEVVLRAFGGFEGSVLGLGDAESIQVDAYDNRMTPEQVQEMSEFFAKLGKVVAEVQESHPQSSLFFKIDAHPSATYSENDAWWIAHVDAHLKKEFEKSAGQILQGATFYPASQRSAQ